MPEDVKNDMLMRLFVTYGTNRRQVLDALRYYIYRIMGLKFCAYERATIDSDFILKGD